MNALYNYQNQLIASTDFSFRRSILDTIEWNERLIGLTGAKGVGKTTCLLQHLSESKRSDKSCLYLSIDDLSNPYPSILSLAKEFIRQGGETLIIDEIHKYSNWAAEIKNIYDLFPKLQVIFSGSSVLKIMDKGVDLSRRAVIYHMHGLSFREYIEIVSGKKLPVFSLSEILTEHISIARSILMEIRPYNLFPEYLKHGYYPYFLQSRTTYPLKLQAAINYILEQEIPSVFNIDFRNIQKMRRALQYIAANVPYQPNITKLAEAVELNRNTLLQYLGLLEQAEITISLNASGSFYGKLTKPGKILLNHPNIIYVLSANSADRGNLRECFFVNQLKVLHRVELAVKGDFIVDEQYLFEIGGKGKTRRQIAGKPDGFIIADDLEVGIQNKIPLWLFGFLY